MDVATARFWLDTIAAILAVLWFAGAWFVMQTGNRLAEPLTGTADVAQDPANVMQRFARLLVGNRPGSPLQRATIEAANDREVRWSTLGAFAHHGTARASGSRDRARVEWEIVANRPALLWTARVVVAAGAVVTVGLWYALHEFAVPNTDDGFRAQVVQMVQAIHVLWPPFLLAGLARRFRREPAEEVRRAVQNAPFG